MYRREWIGKYIGVLSRKSRGEPVRRRVRCVRRAKEGGGVRRAKEGGGVRREEEEEEEDE